MNRAEHIMAVVNAAVEHKCLPSDEAARILTATLAIMNRGNHTDKDLDMIHREVNRRYSWVMVEEENKPW